MGRNRVVIRGGKDSFAKNLAVKVKAGIASTSELRRHVVLYEHDPKYREIADRVQADEKGGERHANGTAEAQRKLRHH